MVQHGAGASVMLRSTSLARQTRQQRTALQWRELLMTVIDDTPPEHAVDGLADRLASLTALTPLLGELQVCEVRGHVAGVLDYLHDEVLPQAHAEELALFPILDRIGSMAGPALAAEHDTVREVTAELDGMQAAQITTASVGVLSGLLMGAEALLTEHLDHEGDALDDLAQLNESERAHLLEQLNAGHVADRPARPTWLPEDLEHEETIGSADMLEPEAMVGASCPPTVLAVARSAVAAASAGVDATAWRIALLAHSRYRLQVPGAEQCMRGSGLWPWASAG
jgi:hypothetical protein